MKLRIGKVARAVAGAFHARVRDDQRPFRQRQHLVHRLRRGVRQVDEDPLLFELAQPFVADRREPALPGAVGGTGDFGVDKVRRRHHPETGCVEGIDRRQIAFGLNLAGGAIASAPTGYLSEPILLSRPLLEQPNR